MGEFLKKVSSTENGRLICLLLLFVATVVAQEEPTFRTQSNVVLVPALVRDKAGEMVYGLQAKDFIIEDDGVAQTVHLDEAAEDNPVSVVVAVQCGRRADFQSPCTRTAWLRCCSRSWTNLEARLP